MGSTGNLPVPVGNLPNGFSRVQKLSGKLPARTGGSPVLPSKF